MAQFTWRRWLRSWLFADRGSQPKPLARRRQRQRLALEYLEDRVTPSVDIWTGKGNNPNWSTGANWASLAPPVNGDTLDFPAVASNFNSVDNIAGASFAAITFDGGGYTIT